MSVLCINMNLGASPCAVRREGLSVKNYSKLVIGMLHVGLSEFAAHVPKLNNVKS